MFSKEFHRRVNKSIERKRLLSSICEEEERRMKKTVRIAATKFTFNCDNPLSKHCKKGSTVIADALVFGCCCSSGILLRVVSLTKKPRFLDIGWFKEWKGIKTGSGF
jgi:hypothetical protein